jgi:beta-glucosidase
MSKRNKIRKDGMPEHYLGSSKPLWVWTCRETNMKIRMVGWVGPWVATILVGCGSQTSIVGENDRPERPESGETTGGTDSDASPTQSPSNDADYPVDDPSLPAFACGSVASQRFDQSSMHGYSITPAVRTAVDETLSAMSPEQKYSQLLGLPGIGNYADLQRSPDVEVPDVGTIRGFRYRDGVRGVNLESRQDNRVNDYNNFATAFPTPSVRAASWDVELERKVGAAIGDETAASKNNVLIGPGLTLLRHPYWGRSQESYGEASYLVGRMGSAFAVGVQEYVTACAKSFTANNIEMGRASMDALISEQSLREVYTRPFEMVVQDAGVGCVLAAYNLVNGTKMTQNEHLLRDVLKGSRAQGGMGFQGFVISDWWAMPDEQAQPDPVTAQFLTNEALRAGLDVELPWQLHYSPATLENADPSLVDDAVRRVLTQKYRSESAKAEDGWSKKPPTSTLVENSGSLEANTEHEALAERVALESMVLLSNGLEEAPVLPLGGVDKIAVVGPAEDFSLVSSSVPKSCPAAADPGTISRRCTFQFATDPALGDRASTRVNADPERSVGPFAGIVAAAGEGSAVTSGSSPEAAEDADAIVVVVGYTPGDEGEEYAIAEGGDRNSLELPEGHQDFVQAVLDYNKPTVIVVQSGSIVNLPWLTHPNQNQATIWAGYSGARGGLALGKLLFGKANFSGKLPMAWPAESELAPFKDSETSTEMDYFFGYRAYDRQRYVEGEPVDMVFPFGHGLSYASFEYDNLEVPCQSVTEDAVFKATVDVANNSEVDGDEVVMLFVKPPSRPGGSTGERPWKELVSFARISVPAGETVTAELPVRVRDLRRWQGGADGRWTLDPGEYRILVGRNADDAETSATSGTFSVSED